MRKLSLVVLSALFVPFALAAAEPSAPPVKAVPAAATAAPAASQKGAALSQQDKMRLCSMQATVKKGAERKAFMKSCLSRKA